MKDQYYEILKYILEFLISLVAKQISWIELYEILTFLYSSKRLDDFFLFFVPPYVLSWQRGAIPAFTDGVFSLPGCPPDEHGV